MAGEVGERLRPAGGVEIAGGGDEQAVVRREAAGDEGGIVELADADGDVIALADDVDEAVREFEMDDEVGIGGEEGPQVRGDVQPAEGGRRRDAQCAAGEVRAAGEEGLDRKSVV